MHSQQTVGEFEPRQATSQLGAEVRKLRESWRTYDEETTAEARKLHEAYVVRLYEFVIRGLLWGAKDGDFLVEPRIHSMGADLYVFDAGERSLGVLHSRGEEESSKAAKNLGVCPLEARRLFVGLKEDLREHEAAWSDIRRERNLPYGYKPNWGEESDAVVARVKLNREKAAVKAKPKRRRKAAAKPANVIEFAKRA